MQCVFGWDLREDNVGYKYFGDKLITPVTKRTFHIWFWKCLSRKPLKRTVLTSRLESACLLFHLNSFDLFPSLKLETCEIRESSNDLALQNLKRPQPTVSLIFIFIYTYLSSSATKIFPVNDHNKEPGGKRFWRHAFSRIVTLGWEWVY